MKLVISTAPVADAPALARSLVERKLVACVNMVPQVRSIYTWQGELCDDTETMLFMKTTPDRAAALVQELKALHPYDVPEIIAVDIDGHSSNPDYLDWISESVSD